jgi:hypothetical protein
MLKEVYGTFLRPDGTPAANAILTLTLSQDCVEADGTGIVGHYPVVVELDENGSIPFSGSLEGMLFQTNDTVLPAGTYTTVSLVDPVFGRIFHEHLVIAGNSPINLAEIVPALA